MRALHLHLIRRTGRRGRGMGWLRRSKQKEEEGRRTRLEKEDGRERGRRGGGGEDGEEGRGEEC